ncbi:MAG: sensor histidine kinase [Candidatus Acidulodesulfobacterium sp.]
MKRINEGDFKNLYNKLKFAITFRVLAFSLIVLSYVILNYKDIIRYSVFIYFFTFLVIFITILYYLILFFFIKKDNYKFLVFFGFFQLSIDFLFISLLIIFSSGLNDKFIFLYYILILIAGFIFLKSGVLIYGIASSLAIGLSADFLYYFDIGSHYYFLHNPDKLLFITSTNILGVLIFTWLFYRFSGELGNLSNKIIEKDEFIKKSQNFNRELFNSFSQGIIVIDENFNIVFINEAAVKIVNLDSELNFKNKTGILFDFDVKITDIFENFPVNVFLKKEKIDGNRFEINHKNTVLGFAVTEHLGDAHKIGNYILVFKDITYIKELEMESRIDESLKTAGKFAGWLAHEIRNPLSAINTSVYVLDSGYSDIKESDHKRLINIIKTESERLNNLVTDFLGLIKTKSKAANGNFENFNLYRLINEIILNYAGGTEVKIHNSVCKEENMFSDKNRIIQIFSNLIQNAVQSVETSMSNSIKENKKRGIVRIGAKKDKKTNFISVTVADNGEGMDDFTFRNAFKPLFSTKENGFGLGLSIVYSVTESLGGNVSTVSRKSVGTLIKIDIPDRPVNDKFIK